MIQKGLLIGVKMFPRPATKEEIADTDKIMAEAVTIRGLGDVVARITKFVGLKPCGGCKKRQEWLNEKVPFRKEKDGHG